MNLHLIRPERDPETGKIRYLLALEFEPEQWDKFAADMAKTGANEGNPDRNKVLRIFSDIFHAMLKVETEKSIVVPVEHVTPAMMSKILGRKKGA